MTGQSFELTDRGIVPSVDNSGVISGGAFLNQIRDQGRQQNEAQTPASQPQTKKPHSAPLKPGDVVGAAKARIREIKATLREHAKLQRELSELQRLVAAAKQKPRANIRALDSARRAG